jgi:hypothetical protein
MDNHPNNSSPGADWIKSLTQELAAHFLRADITTNVGKQRVNPADVRLMLLNQFL